MEALDIKISIHALIMSCKNGLTVRQLLKDLKNEEELSIPYKDFGFDNVFDFLHSIPDVVKFQSSSTPHMDSVLLPVSSSKTSHIEAMIAAQKDRKMKKSKLSRYSDNFLGHHNYSTTIHPTNFSQRGQPRRSYGSLRPSTPKRTSDDYSRNSDERSTMSRDRVHKSQPHEEYTSTASTRYHIRDKENCDGSRNHPQRSRSSPNHLEHKGDACEAVVVAQKTLEAEKLSSENNTYKSKNSSKSESTSRKPHSIANVPLTSSTCSNSSQTHLSTNPITSGNSANSSSLPKFLLNLSQRSQYIPRQTKLSNSYALSAETPSESLPQVNQLGNGLRIPRRSYPVSNNDDAPDNTTWSKSGYLHSTGLSMPVNPHIPQTGHLQLKDLSNVRKINGSQPPPTDLQSVQIESFNLDDSIVRARCGKTQLSQMSDLTDYPLSDETYCQSDPSQDLPPHILNPSMYLSANGYLHYNQKILDTSQPDHSSVSDMTDMGQQDYPFVPGIKEQNPRILNTSQQLRSSLGKSAQYYEASLSPDTVGTKQNILDLSNKVEPRSRRLSSNSSGASSANKKPPSGYATVVQPLVLPGFKALCPQHPKTDSNNQCKQKREKIDVASVVQIPGSGGRDKRCLPPFSPDIPTSPSVKSTSNATLSSCPKNPAEAYSKYLLQSSCHDKPLRTQQPDKPSRPPSIMPNLSVATTSSSTGRSIDSKTVDNRSVNSKTIDKRSVDSKTIDKRSVDSKTIDNRSVETKSVDREIQFVGKKMHENLVTLMKENPDGIRCAVLPKLYEVKYKVPLNYYRDYGTPSVFSFVERLPSVFKIVDLSSGEDWVLLDPEKEVPDKYLHRELIPDAIEDALLNILRRCCNGFFLDEFPAKYKQYYGIPINFKDYPAFSWSDVVAHCTVVKKLAKAQRVGGRWFFRPLSKDPHLLEHQVDALPAEWKFLNPKIAFNESTFVLKTDQLSKVDLSHVEKFDEILIILQDGNSPHNLSAILSNNLTSLNEMMDDLNEVYNALDQDELLMEPVHVTQDNVCVARYGDGLWHRCKILRPVDSSTVELLFLDFGTIDSAPSDTLKYMTRDYSTLPLQCLYVSLYRVLPVTGQPVWDRKGLDRLLAKYENVRVNAIVFRCNPKEPCITSWITARDSEDNVIELNKEFCDWGFGELDLSSIPSSMQEIPIPGDNVIQPIPNQISLPRSVQAAPDSDQVEENNSASCLLAKPALKNVSYSEDNDAVAGEDLVRNHEIYNQLPPNSERSSDRLPHNQRSCQHSLDKHVGSSSESDSSTGRLSGALTSVKLNTIDGSKDNKIDSSYSDHGTCNKQKVPNTVETSMSDQNVQNSGSPVGI